MATFEITIDDTKIQDLLQSDQGLSALLGPILNQVLDAEMAEHLQAAPHEQTDRRHGLPERLLHAAAHHAGRHALRKNSCDEGASRPGGHVPNPLV